MVGNLAEYWYDHPDAFKNRVVEVWDEKGVILNEFFDKLKRDPSTGPFIEKIKYNDCE